MGDFVRNMHENSGLLDELDAGLTMAEAEQQVLAYIREHCPDGSRPPLAGNTVATDRAFLSRDMPELEAFLHYRIVDVSSIKELVPPLVPAGLLPGADQARQPPGAGRHPGEHRGAALLPRGRLRALPRPRQRAPRGPSPRSTAAPSPVSSPLAATRRPIPRNPALLP